MEAILAETILLGDGWIDGVCADVFREGGVEGGVKVGNVCGFG